MEIFLASAIGIVVCYIYTNSNEETVNTPKRKERKSSNPDKKTASTISTSQEIDASKPTTKKVTKPVEELTVAQVVTKPKPIVKKPDYSMQLINNMLDNMLADESH